MKKMKVLRALMIGVFASVLSVAIPASPALAAYDEEISVDPSQAEIGDYVDVEGLDLDPTFQGGSVHTASAVLSNPTTVEFTYTIELYLGIVKVATSGVASVTIPAGGSVTASFPITAPTAEGEHLVFLDVHVGTELVKHYQATENVVVEVTPAIDIDFIGWV